MDGEIQYETYVRDRVKLISFSETGPEAEEVSKLLEEGWVITRLVSNDCFSNKSEHKVRASSRLKSRYTAMLERLDPDFEERLILSKRKKLELVLA